MEIIFAKYPAVTVERYQGNAAHWRLNIAKSWFNDAPDAGINVYGLFWKLGWPEFGAVLLEHWPDAPASGIPHQAYCNAAGQAEANWGLYNSMPALDLPGPYQTDVQGASDTVKGLGLLPGKHHVEWWLYWEWTEPGQEPEQPVDDTAIRARMARALRVGCDAAIADLEKDA